MCVNQKLIRLTANSADLIGRQAIFETIFNDGILIEPNSSIALQSVSFTRNSEVLTIDTSNDSLTMNTDLNTSRTIRIPHGEYDELRFLELLNTIQDKLNNTLTKAIPDVHVEVEVIVNDQEKVEINMNKSQATNFLRPVPTAGTPSAQGVRFSTIDIDNVKTNTISYGGTYMTAVRQNPPEIGLSKLEAYIFSTIPISNGSPQFKARINNYSGGQGGLRIGFLEHTTNIFNKLDNNNIANRIAINDFECLVQTNLDGTNTSVYQFLSKTDTTTTLQDSTIVPNKVDESGVLTDNDILSIENVGGGLFEICVNTTIGSGTRNVIGTYTRSQRYANGQPVELLCYIGIADQFTRVSLISCNLHSRDATNSLNEELAEETQIVGATPFPRYFSLPSRKPSIIFGSVLLANFLGYNSLNQNPLNQIRTISTKFLASDSRSVIFSTNTYLVEMLSEQLDSYDSYDGGRKNILSAVPATEPIDSGIVTYEPNNLVYINLKNKERRLIRNINARIVSDQYEPFVIIGLAKINILIKNEG